jgi:hypothetical protein
MSTRGPASTGAASGRDDAGEENEACFTPGPGSTIFTASPPLLPPLHEAVLPGRAIGLLAAEVAG